MPQASFRASRIPALQAIICKTLWTSFSDNFEIPLAQAKENGEGIDEQLLELAASIITEITTNPDW